MSFNIYQSVGMKQLSNVDSISGRYSTEKSNARPKISAPLVAMGLMVLCIVVTALMLASGKSVRKDSSSTTTFEAAVVHDWSKFHLETSNEYGELKLNYPWLSSSADNILFEAYKDMEITAKDFPLAGDIFFKWEFKSVSGEPLLTLVTDEPKVVVRFETSKKMTLRFATLDKYESEVFTKQYTIYTK